MKLCKALIALIAVSVMAGCASTHQRSTKQTASVVDYLYPEAKTAPTLQPTVTALRPPVKVGIAFVPGGGWGSGLSETAKTRLLERVSASFSKHPYIGKIEIIPSQYMQAKGGFTNLEQVARMFDVEVVALLSYDQVQFSDTNSLAVLYWTIIGAYVIHGDQYDIQTMVDASVFDVASRKLLFRAPGTSQVKGSASMAGFSERSRQAQTDGYNQAIDQLIPNLQAELDRYRERIKTDASVRVENKAGYNGGGAAGWLGALIAAALGLLAAFHGKRPRKA
ncbi:rhombotarget lipoprotein [Oxalobacteraceae bacterium A2-2]